MTPTLQPVVTVEINGERYEHEVPAQAPARPLPPRRPRPHRHPHRLRHGQLRRLHGAPRRGAREELLLLAVQADGASVTTVEGLARRRRADAAPAVVLGPPRPPVRLLHAGDADERDRAARARTRARPRTRSRSRSRATSAAAPATGTSSKPSSRPGRRSRMTAVETEGDDHPPEGLRRAERPAQGGPAARPGAGRLLRRRQAARDGLRPLRPLAVRARAGSSSIDVSRRSSSPASTGRSRATRSRS